MNDDTDNGTRGGRNASCMRGHGMTTVPGASPLGIVTSGVIAPACPEGRPAHSSIRARRSPRLR